MTTSDSDVDAIFDLLLDLPKYSTLHRDLFYLSNIEHQLVTRMENTLSPILQEAMQKLYQFIGFRIAANGLVF